MFTKKTLLRAVGASLAAVLSLAAQPLRAQGSDAERLQKLERPSANYKSAMPSLNRRFQD